MRRVRTSGHVTTAATEPAVDASERRAAWVGFVAPGQPAVIRAERAGEAAAHRQVA